MSYYDYQNHIYRDVYIKHAFRGKKPISWLPNYLSSIIEVFVYLPETEEFTGGAAERGRADH